MSDLLLFLGAGVSTSFEVPVMSKMVEEFETQLLDNDSMSEQGRHYLEMINDVGIYDEDVELYSEISNVLRNEFGRYDLETVLIVLQTLSDSEKKDAYEAYILSLFGKRRTDLLTEKKKHSATKLKTMITQHILGECMMFMSRYERYRHLYSDFFKMFEEIDPSLYHRDMLPFSIYTTNYDRYLDRYLQERYTGRYSTAVTDYFLYDGIEGRLRIDPGMHFSRSFDPSNEYVKLHGSTNWYLAQNGEVIQRSEPTEENRKRRVLLYPTSEKPYYLNPWANIMMLFRRALERKNHWIAIGYSFNDDYLRGIFEEKLESSMKKLLIISPNGKDTAQKFFKGHKNVVGINCEFSKIRDYVGDIHQWFSSN